MKLMNTKKLSINYLSAKIWKILKKQINNSDSKLLKDLLFIF